MKLIPFSLTVGPFNKTFDFSKFDLDIFQLASIDNNVIQHMYRFSDLKNFTDASEVFRWERSTNDIGGNFITLFFNFDKINNSE
jgi:hypothetical protein